MPDVVVWGSKFFILECRPVRRPEGLDSLMMRVQTDAEDSFKDGGAPPLYPLMRIKEAEVTIEVPGQAYEHRLQCDGLMKTPKEESYKERQPEEGWDEISLTILTTDKDALAHGSEHPDYEHMVVTDRDPERVAPGIWRISVTYKGIMDIKARKRRYSSNGKAIKSLTEFVIAGVAADEPHNWVTPRQQITFTERYLSLSPPPTELIGQQLTGGDIPTDTPTIEDNPVDFLAPDLNWNFPYGWRIEDIQGERLLDGRDEHDVTVRYAFIPLFEPAGSGSA